MIIAIFPNIQKKNIPHIALGVVKFLKLEKIHIVAPDEQCEALGIDKLSSVNPKDIDYLISMGGDGTILRLKHFFPQLEAPIFAINLGSLGFMADIAEPDIYPSLKDFLAGRFTIEKRVMMEAISPIGETFFAVNETVIHRSQNPNLVDISIQVDDLYLNTFSADGIIIATPSGSTAYSLAAGGPILTPNLEAFVVTPISPHTISNRPIVLMPEKEIQVQFLNSEIDIEVTFDGTKSFPFAPGEILQIKKSQKTFDLVKLSRQDYFSTLRKKLGWTGKLAI
jgi:NAD+ kinase